MKNKLIIEFVNEWTDKDQKTFYRKYLCPYTIRFIELIILLINMFFIISICKTDLALFGIIFWSFIGFLFFRAFRFFDLLFQSKVDNIIEKVNKVYIYNDRLFLDNILIDTNYTVVLSNQFIVIRNKKQIFLIALPEKLRNDTIRNLLDQLSINYQVYNKRFIFNIFKLTGKLITYI